MSSEVDREADEWEQEESELSPEDFKIEAEKALNDLGWTFHSIPFNGEWIFPIMVGFENPTAEDSEQYQKQLGVTAGFPMGERWIDISVVELLPHEYQIVTTSGEAIPFNQSGLLEALKRLPNISEMESRDTS